MVSPAFDSDGFHACRDGLDNQRFKDKVKSLNRAIAEAESLENSALDTYFNMDADTCRRGPGSIVDYELVPMLKGTGSTNPVRSAVDRRG